MTYSQTYNKDFSLGGTLLFYDAGKFELNTAAGDTSQVNAERDYLGVVTGAYKLHFMDRDFWTGANLKLLHSTLLDSVSAFSAAVDLGAQYPVQELTPDLVLGLAVRNLGTPMKYAETADPLPLSLLAGASYKVLKGSINQLLIAADVSANLEQTLHGNLGLEYWREEMVALRAGYKIGYDLDGFTLGAGFRYLNFQVDYSFAFMSALNSVQKVGLTYTLGMDAARKKDVEESKPKAAKAPVPSKPAEPLPPVMAEVLELSEVIGGDVRSVILSVGRDQGIRAGMTGSIINGSPVAKLLIEEVYPMRCKAKVVEKSGEIGKNAKAEVYKEKPKP